MRLAIVSLLLLGACGSDPDPHAIGVCDGWVDNQGNPFMGMCEAACKRPPTSTGNTCDTTARLNCAAFEFEDIDGCCVEDGTTIRFYECVGAVMMPNQ